MSLPPLSSWAPPKWRCSAALRSLLWQQQQQQQQQQLVHSHGHYTRGACRRCFTCGRLRSWTVPEPLLRRHAARPSSTAADPPQPDERLRLIKTSDLLNEGQFEKLSGFWRSAESRSASDEVGAPVYSHESGNASLSYPEPSASSTPSGRLLVALERAGFAGLIPRRPQRKVDLSFLDVRRLEARPFNGRRNGHRTISETGEVMVLSDGLAAFVTHVLAPALPTADGARPHYAINDAALDKVYTPEYLKLLRARGYEVEDVMTWAWIVTSQSADQAVKRLFTMSTTLAAAGRTPAPLFVFLLILRSRHISAKGLKLLMNMLWTRTPTRRVQQAPSSRRVEVSEQSAVILIVRLIRHARKVWPEALGEIVSLMVQLIGPGGKETVRLKPEQAQRLCHIYNRVLSLLSLPTSANPFRAVAIQQQAQFRLLRQMNELDPKLPVTREGFRALAKVQLAHKKTDMERRWARFKALSWPPWKENKSGVDAESGLAGSLSRAIYVLARMGESGYNTLSWEKRAQVLAGWDTDRSPTIQRRKLLDRPPLIRSISALGGSLSVDPDRDHEIWAARISATRTVKEAWACFCSFEKECVTDEADFARQTPGRLAPWHAMFERLFYAAKDLPGDHIDPGDGKETYPEPTSPHDFLYVPTEPPSVGDLFNKMVAKGLKPAGRLLADLVDHAPTVSEGFQYISESLLTEIKKDVLRHAEKYHPAYIRETLLSTPDFLIAAFVRLLTRIRFSDLELYRPASASSLDSHRSRPSTKIRVSPYAYAAHLVKISATPYPPVWQALFAGLLRQLRKSKLKKESQYDHAYRIWISMKDLLQMMTDQGITVDVPCLQIIYQISEEVILCSPHLGSAGRGSARDITNAAKVTVKSLFHRIVAGYGDPPSTLWLPIGTDVSLLTVPSPANLPGLVRVLGIAGDSDAIMSLLRWMSRFAVELGAVSKEVSNGQRMLRRTLITMRVFLERSWAERDPEPASVPRQFLIDEAQKLVLQHGHWGGWPTDEEVDDYLKKNKSAWLHRIRELEQVRTLEDSAEVEHSVPQRLA